MSWFRRADSGELEAANWAEGIKANQDWSGAVAAAEALAPIGYPTEHERKLRRVSGEEAKYRAALSVLKGAGRLAIEPLVLNFCRYSKHSAWEIEVRTLLNEIAHGIATSTGGEGLEPIVRALEENSDLGYPGAAPNVGLPKGDLDSATIRSRAESLLELVIRADTLGRFAPLLFARCKAARLPVDNALLKYLTHHVEFDTSIFYRHQWRVRSNDPEDHTATEFVCKGCGLVSYRPRPTTRCSEWSLPFKHSWQDSGRRQYNKPLFVCTKCNYWREADFVSDLPKGPCAFWSEELFEA